MPRSRSEVIRFATRFGLTEADVDRILAERAGRRVKPQRLVRLAMRPRPQPKPPGLRVSVLAELRAKGRDDVLTRMEAL